MKTTYIKIFAGLCNRLFQYSYGKYLLSQNKQVKFIVADDGNTDILDILDVTHIENLFYTSSNCGKFKLNLIKLYAKYIAKNYKVDFFQNPDLVHYADIKFKNEELYTNDSASKKIIQSNAVSLHIRGGDYLDPKTAVFQYGVCTKKYYKGAVKKIGDLIENPLFVIFTNDRKYAESIITECKISKNSFVFADDIKDNNYDDGFDLYLMSKCKANIIANSTFSWWGANLNTKKHPVICPFHWSNREPYYHEDLLLPDWIKIPTT